MNRTLNSHYKSIFLVLLITISLLVETPTTFAQETNPKPQMTTTKTNGVVLYLPYIVKIINTDLTIGHIEITQAVQTDTNSVTLVANRQTVVRIYTQTNTYYAINGVYVSISAYRSGSELPGSPLIIGPGTSLINWSRADINTSFNTTLPSSWLSGSVTLNVTVDPSDAIDEKDETNNTVTEVLKFTSVPALNIKLVPIRYTHSTGNTYPAPSPAFIQAAFERFYPVSTVNVTVRSEYSFSGDLTEYSSWRDLLNIITTMKTYDEAPESEVYFGLIPLLDNNGYTWWYGGYAGLGWIGYRESIGLTEAYLRQFNYYVDGSDNANHEVGHNFGRYHAPCGEPGNIDPDYPYPGGIVGQYGFDMRAWQVIPTSSKDIMGYCDINWVSDYTYLGLLQNQLTFGLRELTPQTTDSLYVRANINGDGSAVIEPIYPIADAPDEPPTESEYSLEFVDANGEPVVTLPVAVHLAVGQDFQARSIHTTVPKPGSPFSSIRLTKNGVTVSERPWTQSTLLRASKPVTTLENGELILDWGMPQIPALVRYTIDQGESWTTLGFDILEGKLRMDPQSLPLGSLLFEIILADTNQSTLNITWEHIP